MAKCNRNNNGGNKNDSIASWIIVVIALTVFWPIGLLLLFRKLMGGSSKCQRKQQPFYPDGMQYGGTGRAPGTQGMNQEETWTMRDTAPTGQGNQGKNKPCRETPAMGRVNLDRGKGLTIGGAVTAGVFGISALGAFFDALGHGLILDELSGIFVCLGFCGAGLVMLYSGLQRTKKSKRFRKYLALIGKRTDISITALSQAMPISVHNACEDLQEMLDSDIFPTGYLDMGSGRLILSDEGLCEAAEVEPKPEETPAGNDEMLAQIRAVNDAITDPEMSRKIDRIGEITGKIFAYQRQNPGRDSQLSSFLSYYLPTTLKILHAYAQMEAQGGDGENIRAAKGRIEGMMDKVVEGFEKQLDKLFQDDAMDITTDVEVLERMLDKDGLSNTGELRLGL